MKKIHIILLFASLAFSQDSIVTKNGKKISGKFIKQDNQFIYFKINGNQAESKLPSKNLDELILQNGDIIKIDEFKAFTPRPKIRSTIFFTSGARKKGLLDKNSLDKIDEKNIVEFKGNFTTDYKTYKKPAINFIKSWNGEILYPKGVVGNNKTKKYHLPNVKHLPAQDLQAIFANQKEAKSKSFNACGACFDTKPLIPDYNLEKNIVRQTIIYFQNNNEILYEHPKLSDLQKMVDKVLNEWPETLKGYNYRVQVYRSEEPNAMAIGGGNLYFTSGLLDVIEESVELESIVAHEIAHVEKRHSLKGFRYEQKRQGAVAAGTALAALAVIAAGAEADDAVLLTGAASKIIDYASIFVQKGHSRELEQEADILAQLYLAKQNKNKKSMINILDKLVTHNISRDGFHDSSQNAFASHPNLLRRIYQVENSKMHDFENSLRFTSVSTNTNEVPPGFLVMNINDVFKTRSSNTNEDIIYILGTISNNHPELSFVINKATLAVSNDKNKKVNSEEKLSDVQLTMVDDGAVVMTLKGTEIQGKYMGFENGNIRFVYKGKNAISLLPIEKITGVRLSNGSVINSKNAISNDAIVSFSEKLKNLKVEGLDDNLLLFDTSSEVLATIKVPFGSSEILFNSIIDKKVYLDRLELSAVVLKPGAEKSQRVQGLNKIISSMIVQ